MISDSHLHSMFSSDSTTSPEDIILKAISYNMPYICFTDHSEFGYEDGLFVLNVNEYFSHLTKLKEKYTNDINVLIGVEQGLETSKENIIKEFLNKYSFDFIIGSSHMVNGIDPYYKEYFEGRTTYEAICEYFSSVMDNLKTFDNFDVYGHIDYVIRYAIEKDENYCYDKYAEYLEPILKTIIAKGKGIEINTGGLRSSIKETNPSLEIIKKYKEFGGTIITVGSDAHTIDDIAADFETAKNYLIEAGFEYYNVFINRKPYKINIS